MAGIVGSLLVSVGAQTQDFESGMKRVRREVEQSRTLIGTFTASFTGLTSSLGTAALAAVSVAAITSAIQDVVKTGLELQNLRNSFAAITADAGKSREEFSFIVDQSNKLGLGLQDLGSAYRGLLASTRGTNITQEETRVIFTRLTDASRAYGLTTEQTGRVLLALQQIISKGKVSQEELRSQLGEVLPGASQIAARAFGITTRALDELIAKGLDAGEFTRRFVDQLGRETPASLAIAGKGIAQLSNEILLLKGRINDTFFARFLDDISAGAAQRLREFRAGSEAAAAADRSSLARAGVNADATPVGQSKPLLSINKAIAEEQSRLVRLQGANAPQRAIVETLEVLEKLRTAQREQISLIQIDSLERQRSAALAGQSGAAATERIREENRLKEDETRKTHERFLEISVATNEAATTQEEATRLQASEDERLARARVSLFTTIEGSQSRYLQGLRDELDQLRLTQEALEQKKLDQEALDEPQRKQAQALLDEVQAARAAKAQQALDFQLVKERADAEQDALKALAQAQDRAALEDVRRSRRTIKEIKEVYADFADTLTDSLLDLSQIGQRSFKEIGNSLVQNLLRVLTQTYLRPVVQGGLEDFAGLIVRLIGSGAAVAGGVATEGGLADIPALSAAQPRASGGPIMPGEFYRVGESGPETILAGSPGYVYPSPRTPGGVTVNINLGPGSDLNSFRRGSAEIAATIHRTIVASQRHI